MNETALDMAALRQWIGRTEAVTDLVTPRLAREAHATLDHEGAPPAPGEPAPLAIHWCLAPPAAPSAALGEDGHPRRGGFLPPVPLPRRMWAGSALRFMDRLRVGNEVERRSRIADVTAKEGRSGLLCFVTVEHEIHTPRGLAITERQDIVYRPAPPPGPPPAARPVPLPPVAPGVIAHRERQATPPLLFRYSALTFNGHRIHYDWPYVTGVEGYPGLIVHGPLQATLLLEFAAACRGAPPRAFSFRGLNPLFDFMPFRLCAEDAAEGLALRVETGAARTMEATAQW
ncbi:MaoC family dehydratase N-terminal domain-containing protein [Acidocella sp.]|uniref:FAS1-like dehydratase domain-containing protein n=1 Tax=Acidocella sp. TaxID=50710 RepID=UPI00261062ED|nr:MaoC family dehydratase N-terminal domain-containing protein [Acidocella sp.]